jgi:signal transduction histidine kinase
LGRIVTFNNITEYKNLLKELDVKNNKLIDMNNELKEYSDTVEELTITKERNRFARDVHDTLGHSMTLLISLLEVSNITSKTDPIKTNESITQAIKVAKEGLKELRRSISGLSAEKLTESGIKDALEALIEKFKTSGIQIDFFSENMNVFLEVAYSDAIYRVCQESITNSIRHGKAKHINVILKINEGKIKLFIFDDGIGSKNFKKGYGLTGMEQRIKAINGSLTYGSDGESGFNVHVEIPLKVI